MKKLQGVVTAMVTPFDDGDRVNLVAVRQLTEFLIERGANCLYPTGTTGEMYLLSTEDRKRIASTVIEQARGRATVYIHVGAMAMKDTIDLARHACGAGADGIGVVTPTFFGVTEREMEAYFVDVAASVPADFPVYLYNIPQLSGNDLKPATIARILARCANVVGIKYSYPDMLRVNEYLKLKDGAFSVLIGADRLFVPGLAMGCDGTVSGVACVCPEPFVGIYRACRAGQHAEALKLQAAATEICDLLRNGSNMAVFKAALRGRGIEVGHMRRPLMDLPSEEANRIVRELEDHLGKLGIPLR